MLQIADKLLPILLLIAGGYLLRRTRILGPDGLSALKKLVVNAGLPAVMFLSFLRVELDLRFFLVILLIFFLNLALFFAGKIKGIRRKGNFEPFLMTGFEYGMFAFGVFSVAYGQDAVPLIAVVDLGHELFIWFIFVPAVMAAAGQRKGLRGTVVSFVSSPIIIAIVLGVVFNLLGLRLFLEKTPIASGVVRMLEMVGSMTGPLILLVLGAGLVFTREGFRLALKTLALRLPLVLLLYLAVSRFVFGRWLKLPAGYNIALFVLLVSPPPYVLPVFMGKGTEEEQGRINTTLALYTLVSLAAFMVFFVFFPEVV